MKGYGRVEAKSTEPEFPWWGRFESSGLESRSPAFWRWFISGPRTSPHSGFGIARPWSEKLGLRNTISLLGLGGRRGLEAGGAAEHGALAIAGQGYVSGGGELHVAAFLQVAGEAGRHDVARRRGFGIGNFRRGVHAGEQRRFGDGGGGGMRD